MDVRHERQQVHNLSNPPAGRGKFGLKVMGSLFHVLLGPYVESSRPRTFLFHRQEAMATGACPNRASVH